MTDRLTKTLLSDSQRRLLEAMQRLNFGRIENLVVTRGEPRFDPAPRMVKDIKIGGENGTRSEASLDDFALKACVSELFDHLEQLGDGCVKTIEVKHGLPFRLVIEQSE